MLEIIENSKKYSGLPSIIPIITDYDYVSTDYDLVKHLEIEKAFTDDID